MAIHLVLFTASRRECQTRARKRRESAEKTRKDALLRTMMVDGGTIRVVRRKVRPGDVPDMAQMERLVMHIKDPYKPAVWLLAYTGIRPSELCGLRVRNIDFARKIVSVSETLMPVNRFEESDYGLFEGPTKTEAGDRDIPIPKWLCDDIATM